MTRLAKALTTTVLLATAAVWADPTQYTLQSADGKTFVVKDHLGRPRTFKAKRPCQGIRSSHPVMFERGGPNVTCVSAQIRDLVTNATCSVWCTRTSSDKLAIKPHASESPTRTHHLTAHDSTSLLDLTKPREAPADAGTRIPSLVR